MSIDSCFGFLGTAAGNPTYLIGNERRLTYSRVFTPFGMDMRQKISEAAALVAKCEGVGRKYAWDGGCFRTVKTFGPADPDRFLNCFAYALGHFPELEKLTGKTMREVQRSVAEEIDSVVGRYFTNVDIPREGDLVVYYRHEIVSDLLKPWVNIPASPDATHAGIYHVTEPKEHCRIEMGMARMSKCIPT